jgi:hypothetical protein
MWRNATLYFKETVYLNLNVLNWPRIRPVGGLFFYTLIKLQVSHEFSSLAE